MATQDRSAFATRGEWRVSTFKEAASQSFKAGDPVILSSNKVAIAAAHGSDVTSSTGFLGFAVHDASGVTDADVQVYLPVDGASLFRACVDHATPASAVTALTQIGTSYVGTSTDKGLVIAVDTTGSPAFKIVEIDPTYPTGEQYGWVWVAPLASVASFGKA